MADLPPEVRDDIGLLEGHCESFQWLTPVVQNVRAYCERVTAERDALRGAGHAKGVPSLLCGRTPDGRHYVLTGEAESVNIVSGMLADAERLAEALEMARNGLLWYQDHYPNEINGCDDEAMAAIEAALAVQENPNG